MKNKIISIFLCFSMIFCLFGVTSFAEYKPYSDSQYFTCGDYEIHYRIIPAKGEEKGKILMLHGFLCSTYAWRNLAAEMAENGYECVLADLPSFGYSTRESEDVSYIPRETLMINLMNEIAPEEEWIVAGHSMGGGVAINIAEEVNLKALLLYCPAPQTEFPQWAEKICTSSIMEKTMNAFFEYGTKLEFLVKLVIYAATNDWQFAMDYDVSGVTDAVQYDGFGAGMCEMMYRVRPTDLENTAEITCPVLLINAEKDIIITEEMKTSVSSALPDAETHIIEKAGHQCIENRYEELCDITVSFLDKKTA